MRKLRNMLISLFTIVTILCISIYPHEVKAETAEKPMSIKAILPDNQKDGVKGYFNLQVKPGEKQTIYTEITNNKNKDIIASLMSTDAYTQPTGGIFYDSNLDSPETSIIDNSFALSKNISMDKEIPIKANQTVKVPIDITIPNVNEGTYLGGILIGEKAEPEKQTDEKVEKDVAKFKVITKTVFALAVQLDLPEQVESDFSFGKAGFNSDGPSVFIEMVNNAALIQREISGEYKVSKKDGEELFTGKFDPILMAPKTKINFPMKWESSVLEQGKYTLSMTANVEGEEVLVEEDFNIDNDEVKKYAERTDQPIAQTQGGIPYWVAIVALVIVGLVVYWLARRGKNTTK